MSTNDFLSQFIVGLGFFFLYILMNIQINTISLIYFMLQNYNLFIFYTTPQATHFFLGYTPGGAAAPSAPLLPAVMSGAANIFKGLHTNTFTVLLVWVHPKLV